MYICELILFEFDDAEEQEDNELLLFIIGVRILRPVDVERTLLLHELESSYSSQVELCKDETVLK